MKRIIIIVGTLIAIAGLTTIGFVNEKGNMRDEARQKIPVSDTADAHTENPKPEFTGMRSDPGNKDLNYVIRTKQNRKIVKGKLENARSISDLISNYPSSWITDYVSVEIQTISNAKVRKATSPNDILSKEQKEILNTAAISADLLIDIKYKSKNGANNKIETNEMNVSMSVVPELEAECIAGYEAMIEYLKENSPEEVSSIKLEQSQRLELSFSINEKGLIENIQLTKPSGDTEVDQLLINLLGKMPKWKPAENSKGLKVRQDFQFWISSGFDC